jgi:hypothetical protein
MSRPWQLSRPAGVDSVLVGGGSSRSNRGQEFTWERPTQGEARVGWQQVYSRRVRSMWM